MCDLIHDINILLKMTIKPTVQLNAIFRLLLIKEKACVVKIFRPMVSQLVKNLHPGIFLAAELCQLKPSRPEKWHLVQCFDEYLPRLILVVFLFQNYTK